MNGKSPVWYVEKGGTWYGPFSQAILQDYFLAGKLDLETRIRQSAQEEGRALQQWPELLQALKREKGRLPPKPASVQAMTLLRPPKKKSPWLLLVGMAVALLPLSLLLLPPDHPLNQWMVQNPQRKDLQSKNLPPLEPLLRLAVERLLSFRRQELATLTQEFYTLENTDPVATWSPFYPQWQGTTWPLLQPDGLRLTLLLDEQETCFAVSFQGPGWEKIQQESVSEGDWQPPMVEEPQPWGSQWCWLPLPELRVRLVWHAGPDGAFLERILVENVSLPKPANHDSSREDGTLNPR
jgi:hypothetical protein